MQHRSTLASDTICTVGSDRVGVHHAKRRPPHGPLARASVPAAARLEARALEPCAVIANHGGGGGAAAGPRQTLEAVADPQHAGICVASGVAGVPLPFVCVGRLDASDPESLLLPASLVLSLARHLDAQFDGDGATRRARLRPEKHMGKRPLLYAQV